MTCFSFNPAHSGAIVEGRVEKYKPVDQMVLKDTIIIQRKKWELRKM